MVISVALILREPVFLDAEIDVHFSEGAAPAEQVAQTFCILPAL